MIIKLSNICKCRPVVPDPGALRAFPFWAKLDQDGEKTMSTALIALRLADLRVRMGILLTLVFLN